MFALNFQSPNHKPLLITRKKNCTIRLGDIRDSFPENSLVWITFGKKFEPKLKLYPAVIDKVAVKTFAELTTGDLEHQNPAIKSLDELRHFLEETYHKVVSPDDIVTVIYFSEVFEE